MLAVLVVHSAALGQLTITPCGFGATIVVVVGLGIKIFLLVGEDALIVVEPITTLAVEVVSAFQAPAGMLTV
jgi:hypothetical protein